MGLLAQDYVTRGDSYTGWYIGISVGFIVVIVVVILVSMILMQAQRITAQALEGIDLMDDAREASLSIWDMQHINASSTKIWRSAEEARHILQEAR